MNTTTAYTPLECLLLFQSLVAYGTQEDDFVRISDLLTNNALVKDGETYDAQRLSVDALREFYLQLLRDELRPEDQDGEETTSKKRKIQSPPLPSIKDAQEFGDKLPLLVDRLYARYRDYMIRAIREDEKRYAAVQKDIGEIENGEWDERILKEDKALANGSASPESSRPKINGTNAVESPQENIPKPPEVPSNTSPLQSPTTEQKPEGLAISDVLNSQETPPSPQAVDQRPHVGSQANIPQHQRTGSNGPHGPSPLHPGPPPLLVGPQQPQNYGWAPPYQPNPPQQFNPQYPVQQYPQPHRGSLPSPHLPSYSPVPSSPLNAQHAQYTQHPIVLPHPHPRGSPSSPGMQLSALADAAGQHGQQFRPNPSSPMTAQGQPGGFPPQYAQQRPPSANGQFPQQWQQGTIPHGPGPAYPPNYQQMFVPPPHQQPAQFGPPPIIQPGPSTYNSPYHPSQGKPQTPHGLIRSQPSHPSTPKAQQTPIYSTGMGTRWTPTPTGLTPRPYAVVDKPVTEPISPILPPAKLPELIKKSGKKLQKPELPKSGKASRRGTHRARAGSPASSVIAGSHRSQSVMSHADELSMDEPVSRHVKEEVATPIGGVEDPGDTTADDSSAHPQLPPHRPSPRQSTKRKRAFSALESRSPSLPPTHVLWTRAFPKISASALESVSGHKNASTFSAPVKERDAPGYKNLILRPQDLKSIRSAITAGNRAATAAAPEDLNPSASSAWLPISEDLIPPKGIINYAQLEKELMRMFANAIMFNADPDRGLGRRWQGIGKERGDIVGYEIDEDGVVKDTRAMYSDVEKVVGSLRSAERRSEEFRESSMAIKDPEEDEVDELAGDGEGHAGNTGSLAKRRRKA